MGTEGTAALRPLRPSLPSIDSSADHSATSGLSSCVLPARHEAVKSSREFTRRTLRQWGLAEQFDDVALVVSELVTNALRHGCLPEDLSVRLESPLCLHLMRWTSRLVCAVRDPNDSAPVVKRLNLGTDSTAESSTASMTPTTSTTPMASTTPTASPTSMVSMSAESGRGLYLVECFSDSWGWQPVSGRPGKVVWALFRLGAGTSADTGTGTRRR